MALKSVPAMLQSFRSRRWTGLVPDIARTALMTLSDHAAYARRARRT
jgi:hypothetical protein